MLKDGHDLKTLHPENQDLWGANKSILELMAMNRPMPEILDQIVQLIETFASGCMSTVYFVEEGKLRLGAAPSFPEEFVRAVDGCPIGPANGTCGTAAFLGKRVVSTDITQDDCWGPFREWILSFGFKSAWSTPVLSENGEVLATVSMCWKELRSPNERDFQIVDAATRLMSIVVKRRQQEKMILEQQTQLASSSKLAAVGEMAACVAHEINNPLAIIQLHAEHIRMLIDTSKIPEPQSATILLTTSGIEKTVSRISKIVSGLKAISRDAESEPFQKIELKTWLEDTLAICRERFRSHGVKLECIERSPSVDVEGSPIQLSQVLLNLLNNSFDAVVGNTVKWVKIETSRDEHHCHISVIDSGSGIPTEIHAKLMQPFFTTKGPTNGTGLGLTISRKIIAKHGGTLELDPASAHTRFNIRLPHIRPTV